MLTKKMIRTALNYRAQFLSMILMIAIGVGVFLGFNIEWKSLEVDIEAFFAETAYADYRLYSETGFSKQELEKIEKIEGVTAATRYLSIQAGLKGSEKALALNVSENGTVSMMKTMEGAQYDASADGIWLSDRFAQENGIGIGDSLTLTYMGLEITDAVVGLVKNSENMICVADENQLMPDYKSFGFAYISPARYQKVLGITFYPQINLCSDLEKTKLEETIQQTLGRTILVTTKEEHNVYAGMESEVEEGKTMGVVLPVLFLAIAVLTMVTTMHRIASNEKIQIGTLKALGFRNKKILRHYTMYGMGIGGIGILLGILLAYGIAAIIISPNGMMATYFDLPNWSLVMPAFCIPMLVLTEVFLTLISYWSVKKMLRGTAADALRPYTPKKMKKSVLEKTPFWDRLPFGMKWNIRDVLRHKSRSAMTLVGVFGCMLLLVGGLGMKDTMAGFLDILDEGINHYKTKIIVADSAEQEEALELAEQLDGDWMASSGISYRGNTVSMEIYHVPGEKIRFLTKKNEYMTLQDDGVYLCLRLADTAKIGDTISISPYGSDEIYEVKVAGYFRSLVSECIVMTDTYAQEAGISYRISSIYTDLAPDVIAESSLIAGKQDKDVVMDSYDSFMEIMNVMVVILVAAAVVIGAIVLYNLGVMSYVERYRELATLKVLGFDNRKIGHLLISQNVWLTVIGMLLGLPGGVLTLQILITALASEYELKLKLGILTYSVSILLTLGVSIAVGWMVARKNRKIDMVEALKGAE